MRTHSHAIKALFAIGLLITSSVSLAVPTLKFGGSISYSTDILSSADLNISAVLIPGYTDLSVAPDLATSSVTLSADFVSASSDGNFTTGLFGTTLANDLLIGDNNDLDNLLTANVDSLLLTGREGRNLGILAGTVEITGGLLATDFGGVGSLFAINFNLDTLFAPNMFESDFLGITNGSITQTQVPEPIPLALLSLGLLGMILTRKVYRR